MNIIVSAGGRFHAFYLVQQLLAENHLLKLITTYPKYIVNQYGIPRKKTDSLIVIEILRRLSQELPGFVQRRYDAQFFICDLFDKLASSKVEKSDIFIGWSGFSLYSLRRAKKLGSLTVLERGSSHISYQQRILKEEYDKFGIKFQGAHPKIVEKELREYDEADYIEVPSSFSRRTFLDFGIDEKKVIQGGRGVHACDFRQIPKEDDTFRIVYCGALSLRKGVHYLLQAFSELNLPGAQLWLIGRPSEELKPFLKKFDNGRVSCMGPFPQRELYKYYSQGSIFVIASIEEGLAAVILQAMACGLPVICTSNSGGDDIVRNGQEGFVIPIRNVEALKGKIVNLYESHDLCKNMSEAAKHRITNDFAWSNYGRKIINIYLSLLK